MQKHHRTSIFILSLSFVATSIFICSSAGLPSCLSFSLAFSFSPCFLRWLLFEHCTGLGPNILAFTHWGKGSCLSKKNTSKNWSTISRNLTSEWVNQFPWRKPERCFFGSPWLKSSPFENAAGKNDETPIQCRYSLTWNISPISPKPAAVFHPGLNLNPWKQTTQKDTYRWSDYSSFRPKFLPGTSENTSTQTKPKVNIEIICSLS